MKKSAEPPAHLRGYQAQIWKYTQAPEEHLPIIEQIMRDEVFHSTLDWQTAAEFRTGAKKAQTYLQADLAFHLSLQRVKRTAFEQAKAETAWQQSLQQSDQAVIELAKKQLDLATKNAQVAELALATARNL